MTTHPIYLVCAVGLFVSALLSVAGYAWFRGHRSTQPRWDDLLARLSSIDRNNIEQVALDLVDETGSPKVTDAASLEPPQLWSLVGGLEGLELLEKNSEVIVDLAAYLQQWYPDALVIAERLRQDAREIEWHVARLRGAAKTGNLQVSFPFYAQRAVVTYYRMTRSVLDLYQAGNITMLIDLQKAL